MTDNNKTPANLSNPAGGKDALKGWALMLVLIGVVLVVAYYYAG